MIPYRLLAMSSTLMLAAALAGPAGAPPTTAAAARPGDSTSAGAAAAPAGTAAPAAPAARAAAAAPAAPAAPASPAGPATSSGQTRRVQIPGPDLKLLPYTIEIPAGWQMQASKQKDIQGVFIGPLATEPEKDARMIYVRVSPASLADPEAVVANIKQSDAADDTWSAPLVEVREVGGVRGVLVRMDSGSGAEARSTLVLKMPLGQTSIDFMASAPRAEFERLLPGYQRVILSVQPVR
jgi:hypothetical protein